MSPFSTVTSGPLVSLVIPAYQAERFLAEALDSARSQTYRPLEVIVVDDGSTDDTAVIAQRFPEVICLQLGANRGLPAARNAGVDAATGELIAFLDADDLMLADRIAVQAQYLFDHPRCDCVVPRQEFVVETDAALPGGLTPLDRDGKAVILLSAAMVRAPAIRDIGGFDTSYAAAEDMDFIIRLKSAGFAVDFLDAVLIRRRFHGQNMSYDRELLRRGLLQAVRDQIRRERIPRPPTT